jgi:BirA family biotin operon repressor/biotin-[acetyl-CoA-carboxylase] ligase
MTPPPLTFALLRLLSDGAFHSGAVMARQFQISRASVHAALAGVEALGLPLYRVRGRGYCLPEPPTWLDAQRIKHYLAQDARAFHIEILDSAPSSNTLLLQRAEQNAPTGSVLALEWQSAGRGRMGRVWHSSLGSALTFSLLWRFNQGLAGLAGLSLAVGLALVRALHGLGINTLRLKWPNDLLDGAGNKLAGILIEARGEISGAAFCVIGIGLNVTLPKQVADHIEQPAGSLAAKLTTAPDRNRLFAVILRELEKVLRAFEREGFAAMRAEWESWHQHQNQPVQLSLPNGENMQGIVRGVTDQGALRLENAAGVHTLHIGEISLRGHAAD